MSDSTSQKSAKDKGAGEKKNPRDDKSKEAGAKLVEAGLRFKLSGGGLRGGLEAVPSLLKWAAMMKKIANNAKNGDTEADAKLKKLQKKMGADVTKCIKAYLKEIERAKLKPPMFPKMMPINEKTASNAFLVLNKSTVDYIKLVRKVEKINAKTSPDTNRE